MFHDLDLPVQTDCLSLEGHSQGSTQRWCVLFMVTEPPTLAQQTQTAQSSPERGGEQSEGTQSCLALAVARVSSYLPLRWAAGGHRTRAFVASVGEVQSSTGTTPPAEESRASLEDAVGAILACAAGKAVATCLLDLRCAHGSDGHSRLGGGGGSPPREFGRGSSVDFREV